MLEVPEGRAGSESAEMQGAGSWKTILMTAAITLFGGSVTMTETQGGQYELGIK
jgi:hypothetical protein